MQTVYIVETNNSCGDNYVVAAFDNKEAAVKYVASRGRETSLAIQAYSVASEASPADND